MFASPGGTSVTVYSLGEISTVPDATSGAPTTMTVQAV
jgi:hypothetical protein